MPVAGRRLGSLVLVVLGAVLVPWSWVPGGHVAHVPGSEVFTAAQLRRGQTYSSMQRHLGWASLAVSLALALVLGLTRLGARLVRLLPGPVVGAGAARHAGGPARRRAGHASLRPRDPEQRARVRPHPASRWAAGCGTRASRCWSAGSSPASPSWSCWSPPAARRDGGRCGRRLAGALLTVLGSWVYPVVVEPLFNHFTPLPHGELRTKILALAEKEHVPVSDVLVADASRRTTTLNAYVSGFGSTRRVVLYDNLVDDVPERETLVVVAHELGHARHHDVVLGTALGATGVVLGSGLLGLLLSRRRLLDRAGVRRSRPAGGGGPAAGPGGRGVAAGQPGPEHDQPGHRGAGRPGLAAGDGRLHGVRADAGAARHASLSDPTRRG